MSEPKIETGKNGMGLRWARLGEWRIVAYAEGGYCVQRYVEGPGWCLLHAGRGGTTPPKDKIPAGVEAKLLDALGLPRQ
jgi:hypothetical protein